MANKCKALVGLWWARGDSQDMKKTRQCAMSAHPNGDGYCFQHRALAINIAAAVARLESRLSLAEKVVEAAEAYLSFCGQVHETDAEGLQRLNIVHRERVFAALSAYRSAK